MHPLAGGGGQLTRELPAPPQACRLCRPRKPCTLRVAGGTCQSTRRRCLGASTSPWNAAAASCQCGFSGALCCSLCIVGMGVGVGSCPACVQVCVCFHSASAHRHLPGAPAQRPQRRHWNPTPLSTLISPPWVLSKHVRACKEAAHLFTPAARLWSHCTHGQS